MPIASSVPRRADSAQYFYDPAERLTTVVDPVNGSAQYKYDAVGNILSVVRKPITDVVVAQVTPGRGRAGDVVTIFGAGFGVIGNTSVSSTVLRRHRRREAQTRCKLRRPRSRRSGD